VLAPDDRRTLLDALRPPDGYGVERAIATTFSLDLLALLTAPVAFSRFDGHERDRVQEADPLSGLDPMVVLHSVREHAKHLTVFCQAGKIATPGPHRPLLAYLEDSVVQVKAPDPEGVFHPKLWILKLVPNLFAEPSAPTLFRVIVASRNLTFDKSWDTLVCVDGVLRDRQRGIAASRPLADFVAALPDLALDQNFRDAAAVRGLAQQLRITAFDDAPDPFETLAFHPMGIGRYRKSPIAGRIDRMLVVSPFVNATGLGHLNLPTGEENILVARQNELDALPPGALSAFNRESVYILNDAAEVPEGDDVESVEASEDRPPLHGLHAKLVVVDRGWDADVYTGSLNATAAAHERNVEFLVRLSGMKSKVGVDAILGEGKKDDGLAKLLVPCHAPSTPPAEDPSKQLEASLRRARTALCDAEWIVKVGSEQNNQWPVTLHRAQSLRLEPHIAVSCWPIALRPEHAQPVAQGEPGQVANFGALSFNALTAFMAFDITATRDGLEAREQFVIHARLEGAPADRLGRMLQQLLDDSEKVARFLRLLLADDPIDVVDLLGATLPASDPTNPIASDAPSTPLLESLVRAASRQPERIASVQSVVKDLAPHDEGSKAFLKDVSDLVDALARATSKEAGR